MDERTAIEDEISLLVNENAAIILEINSHLAEDEDLPSLYAELGGNRRRIRELREELRNL